MSKIKRDAYVLAQLDAVEPIPLRVDVIDRLVSFIYVHGTRRERANTRT